MYRIFGGIRARFPTQSRLLSYEMKVRRDSKLREIYAPFALLKSGSDEYVRLAKSGKVWEDYFRPQNTKPYDRLQLKFKDTLDQIDKWKGLLKLRMPQLGKTLVPEYAHQSVKIEHSPIQGRESSAIFDLLTRDIFSRIDLATIPAKELVNVSLPRFHTSIDASAVVELMNHMLASQWIATNAMSHPTTPGLTEIELRQLAALAVKNTHSEEAYTHGWGGRVPLGGYRKAPIGAASHPLRIFPYPQEVAACVQRFFDWRDARHDDKQVHPLIHACHMMVYWLHIHPFPDGNGRVSRMLMHDYMARQGYLPVVILGLERDDYIRMISDSQDGDPGEFVRTVLRTQLEQLETFHTRQHMK